MQQGDEGPTGKTNRWAIPLAVLGVILLAAAAVLYWVVVPNRTQLPSDTDVTRQYDGVANLLLVPQAIASGNLANALLTDVPVTAERNVKVLATDGDAAEASDTRVLKTGTGQELAKTEVNYAVDRKTLEAATDIPEGWDVAAHNGLTISWPIGSEMVDYKAWVNETESTIPVKYVREEEKAGVNTYVYQAESEAAPIKDPQVLNALPKALPTSVLAQLAPRLPLPDAVKGALAQALPALGSTVQLNYTYEVSSTFWVEPTTGIVIDNQREEIRKVTLGSTPLSVPIYDVSTGFNEVSVTDAANDATDGKNSIQLFSTTLPLILLVVGLLALIAGILGWFMKNRRATSEL